MIDYKNELGRVLEKVLVAIKDSAEPVSRDDIAKLFNVSNRIATDYIQALYNRGYIMDFRGDWKDTKNQESKFVVAESRWIISVDGLNYLDLHRYWWTRFWTRSVLCPLIVSLIVSAVTSINAPLIWQAIKTMLKAVSQ